MKDDTLEKIKEFAVNLLRKEKGYCGVASNDDSAIITSECPSGFDIKITIETNKEPSEPKNKCNGKCDRCDDEYCYHHPDY